MNLCVTLLKVVLVVVFIEAVLGDVEGGELGSKTVAGGASSGNEERACPHELVNRVNSSFPLQNFPFIMYSCYEKLRQNTTIVKRPNSTGDESETMVHRFCEETSTPLLECLSDIATKVEDCPDKIFFKIVSIFLEYVGELIETGCAQNGQRFITLYKELTVIKQTSPLLSRDEKGRFKFHTIISELDKSTVDMPSKLFIFYLEIKASVEYINKIQMGQPFKEIMNYFADHLISHIKCIHPTDGTLVTCASIDAALVSSPNICEAKRHGTNLPIYDVLEHDAGKIFNYIMTYYNSDEEEFPDNEKVREGFKQYCSTKTRVNLRLRPVMIMSDICLNETDKNQFQILNDSINSALEVTCTDEGKRLADVMFEVYRLKKTSPDQSHAVWDCIDVAKATRKQSDDHRDSSKNMRFYHELETFKGCFLNKLHRDQTSVDAATSLINEMLKVIKCANPENGTAELCESLMHSNIIDHGH